MPADPTSKTYDGLNSAYAYFNDRLFFGQLPACLITIQRKNRTFGYFAGDRFGTADDQEITDEIALNPTHFAQRSTEQTLSTLVHEMVHLWQHHFGKPSRSAYHNKQWAGKMKEVGLIPSSTGEPGGKETGQKVSHYIADEGPFRTACAEFTDLGHTLPYVERWTDQASRRKKAASKTKYTCAKCNFNVWAKPDAHVVCGDCNQRMMPDEPSSDDA